MSETDLELLRRYGRQNAEDAFREIVRRHLDLVYSAALRRVRSPQLAEEVAQSTFLKLAGHAGQLPSQTIVTAWLYQVARREAIDVVRREARRHLREQIASEMNAMNASEDDWAHIAPLLDEAMFALDETERLAVLLRYFENKSLREVGETLGTSDDAAQKRVSRAVERLREFFANRGVSIGASGLAVVISANAVQPAPIGLALTISTAASFVGITVAASTAATATKAITMTATQKVLIAAALAATVGSGIYEAHRASSLQTQVQVLQRSRTELTNRLQQLTEARNEANARLAAQTDEFERLSRNAVQANAEILQLRNELNRPTGNQGSIQKGAEARSLPGNISAMASQSTENIAAGRELGMAVARGDAGAFEKMVELARAQHKSFVTNSPGLTDTARGELARLTFAPIHAAFDVIAEAASGGSAPALDAVMKAALFPELKGQAIQSLGKLAGDGSDAALDTLVNPEKYGLLLSGVVGALKPAAENGNQKAINALAEVAGDPRHQPLWYMAADGLSKAAESGNTVALDALIKLSASTNRSIQNVVLPALQRAAVNQNAKAADALRSLGIR